jgi:nicotinamide mononucleotide transporter
MEQYIEYLAVALGVVYVVLATRSISWCWPAGILSSALYIYINITHQLFQDAILQTYYVVAGFYGWWLWRKAGKTSEEGTTEITSYNLMQNLKLIAGGALLVPIFGFVFSKLGNSLSYFDSAVTIFSFIATWLTAKRIIENWLFWIVIDLVAATMYYIKHLELTAGLYLFFAAIAIYGYLQWRKQLVST